MRLHELAKEIGAESKALLSLAKELGLNVRNHSSNLAVGEVAILKAAYREEFGDTVPEAPAVEAEPKKKRTRRRAGDADDGAAGATGEGDDATADADDSDADGFDADEADEDSGEYEEYEPEEGVTTFAAEPADDSTESTAESREAVRSPTVTRTEDATRAPDPTRPTAPSAPARGVQTGAASQTEADALRPAAKKAGPEVPKQKPRPVTGKPLQTPTVRRKTSGAKIVGRIELPPEEINRSRAPRPPASGGGGPGAGGGGGGGFDESGGFDSGSDPTGAGRSRFGTPAMRDAHEQQRRRGAAGVPARPKDDPLSWSPDDEDDPLLQGIRIRNVQSGPHTRRPPRRVGPRRSGRRQPPTRPTGPIEVPVPISVRDLSQVLGVKAADILRILMKQGVMAHFNTALEEEGVLEIAAALDLEVNTTAERSSEEEFLDEVDAYEKKLAATVSAAGDEDVLPRAPVVAFLGHVDHGKTSLLDYIRKTNVAAGEAGGITQSMRAYSVSLPSGGSITFLDTPGHKAFTEMRARGAHVTDIVVLVVAGDDGVMPQTEEAIQHAHAAGTPIVVAMNKMDRVEANADRVLQQLAHAGVMVEGWGGEVQVAQVSAVTGMGVDDLLEKLALQAEIMDLKANPNRPARGTVIESYKDDQLGAVCTVLVQEGTLRTSDIVLSGTAFGRVRTMIDDQGRKVTEAGPSTPVNVVGLDEPPQASEPFFVHESLKKARDVAAERIQKERLQRVSGPAPAGAITLENLFANLEAGKVEEVKVVLRCDVQGSLEVVRRSLEELTTSEVKVKILRDALGGITEDDVLLALASEAVVVGFNVIADEKARQLADAKGVEIRAYQVIYELLDDMKKAMEGKLSPIKTEMVVGHVEIREVFKVSRLGNIAGCRVTDGVIRRNSSIRLTRDGKVIYNNGRLDSLKRFKDDVREVKEGLECGLRIDGYDDIKVGDVLEIVEVSEEKRTLDFSKN